MIEQAMVFDHNGKTLLWHSPPGCTSAYIPDTRDLWTFIWEHRQEVCGIAHTHPWEGPASPSFEDMTTFNAIDRALGRPLLWVILSADDRKDFIRGEDQNWSLVPPTFYLEGEKELRSRSGI